MRRATGSPPNLGSARFARCANPGRGVLLAAAVVAAIGSGGSPAAAKQAETRTPLPPGGPGHPASARGPCAHHTSARGAGASWCAEFGFLSSHHRYRVELPVDLSDGPELLSAVRLNGTARSIMFARGVTPSELAGGPSTVHQLYQTFLLRPDLLLRLRLPGHDDSPSRPLFFAIADGYLWTHVEHQRDGPSAVTTLLANLKVTENAQGDPHVAFGQLSDGDQREPQERDQATFYTRRPRHDAVSVSSVTFANDGPYAREAELEADRLKFKDDESAWVTRATPMGVTVTCTGSGDQLEHLRAVTERIAASLKRV